MGVSFDRLTLSMSMVRIFLGVDEGGGRLGAATSKGFDVHLLYVEHFGLFDPIVDSSGDRSYG